jgi:CheY-like chemotaxis protein
VNAVVERILVVDDDPDLFALLIKVLLDVPESVKHALQKMQAAGVPEVLIFYY